MHKKPRYVPNGAYRVFFSFVKTVCKMQNIFSRPFFIYMKVVYRFVRIITMLRLGMICFFTLQTVFPTLIFHFQFSILHLIKTVCTNWERRLAVSRIDFAVDLFDLCLDFAICSKPNTKINKEKNCAID